MHVLLQSLLDPKPVSGRSRGPDVDPPPTVRTSCHSIVAVKAFSGDCSGMRTFGPVTLPESPSGAEGRWLPAHSAGVAMEGYGWQAQKPKRSLLAPGRAHPQPLDLPRQALSEGHTG